MAFSFIGGGNLRKPSTCRKSLTKTDCTDSCKSNYHANTMDRLQVIVNCLSLNKSSVSYYVRVKQSNKKTLKQCFVHGH